MAYIMFQYDRPTDTRNWNDYNQRVRDWIAQLLQVPGAVSFVAYRTADGASPNTTTMLEFHTVEEARKAIPSEPMKAVLQGLRSVGVVSKVLVVEHSPFTPEPIRT
jgi:phosphohistidine phosphatase SixA